MSLGRSIMKKPSATQDANTLDMVLLFSMPLITAILVAIIWYLGAQSASLAS